MQILRHRSLTSEDRPYDTKISRPPIQSKTQKAFFPLPARVYVSPHFPWQLAAEDVKSEEVQAALHFLMSNPPRKVNTTATGRFGSEGDHGKDAYTVVYNVL